MAKAGRNGRLRRSFLPILSETRAVAERIPLSSELTHNRGRSRNRPRQRALAERGYASRTSLETQGTRNYVVSDLAGVNVETGSET